MLLVVQTSFALTFTVTVPEGTKACYIAGSFNDWTHQAMTSVGSNKYTIEIAGAQSASAKYKYCSGPGWQYVEKTSSGAETSDRSYNANDVVARWAAVYEPSVQAGDITITANVPSNTPDGEVYIVGSFLTPTWDETQALKMTKLSASQYRITIPNVTDIAYKLTCAKSFDNVEVDASGNEINDRQASVTNPNVTITVAGWRSTSTGGTGEPGNYTIERHTFSSFTPLQGSRRVVIYLPPDYNTNTDKRYSVLYMHDAQNVFETGAFGTWNMAAALQQLYNTGKHVGIVVTIDNSAGRLKEYAPFGNSQYEGGVAQGDDYLQAINNHIIPYINANYRTLTDKENTGILGSSMGGLISYYAGLKHSDTFGRIGAMSPSFWFCKTALTNYVNNWTGTTPEQTKIYFICGNNEDSSSMVSDMQSFYNLTKTKGFTEANLQYEVVQGGGHNEASWAAQIGRVYEFLFNNNTQSSVDTPTEQLNVELKVENNHLQVINKIGDVCGFKLYDASGRIYADAKVVSSYQTSVLSSGVYIAQIKHNEQIQSQKLIIK